MSSCDVPICRMPFVLTFQESSQTGVSRCSKTRKGDLMCNVGGNDTARKNPEPTISAAMFKNAGKATPDIGETSPQEPAFYRFVR